MHAHKKAPTHRSSNRSYQKSESMSTPLDSHFLIIAPDISNAKREEYKAPHLEYNGPLFQSGYIGEFEYRARVALGPA